MFEIGLLDFRGRGIWLGRKHTSSKCWHLIAEATFLLDNLAKSFRGRFSNYVLSKLVDVKAESVCNFFKLSFPLSVLLVDFESLFNLIWGETSALACVSGLERLVISVCIGFFFVFIDLLFSVPEPLVDLVF